MEQTILQVLKGEKLTKLGFNWEIAGCLVWYEIALHSHAIDGNNEDYFHCLVDSDEFFSRWILFKTPIEKLWQFFSKKITNQELMMQSPDGFIYFIDVSKNEKTAAIEFYKTAIKDIPEVYYFPENSYFDESTYEDYALALKTYVSLHHNRKQVLYRVNNPNLSMVAEPKTEDKNIEKG